MKKVSSVIVIFTICLMTLSACSPNLPQIPNPTPNIDATVQARVAEELSSQTQLSVQPTYTPYPTHTPLPQPTYTPYPTHTPLPQPTYTPTPIPTFQVVDRIANTPEPPMGVPKEAMPSWATEQDCEVHFESLLVCAHMIPIKNLLDSFGVLALEIEATLSNLTSGMLENSRASFDVYDSTGNLVISQGIILASKLPPGITYQDTTSQVSFPTIPIEDYKVVISEVCTGGLFQRECVYGYNYQNP